MSSTPVQEYAILDEVKFKLNIDTSDTSQDVQITVATNDSNNYIAEQTAVHATVIVAGNDPSLSSMANNLAAAYFNFWLSTEKDREELERWQNRIQQYIMAKYGKKSANMLSGEDTIGVTSGFVSSSSSVSSDPCDCSPLTTKGDIWGYDVTDNRIPIGADTLILTADSSTALGVSWQVAGSGSGNVIGPISATDNAIARYDTTTGKLIQNSGVIIDDSNNVTGVLSIEIGDGTWTISEDGSDELLFTSPTGDGSHGIKVVSDTGEIILQNIVSNTSDDYTALLSTNPNASSDTTDIAFSIQNNITSVSDSGTEPITQIQGIANGGLVGTRPIIGFYNFNTKLLQLDSDGTADFQGNTITNAVLEANLTNGSIYVGNENNALGEIPTGLETKEDCRIATTTSNIDLSSATNPNPIDGVTLSTNERILLKNQTDASENGIYNTGVSGTNPTNWNRATDANTSILVNNGMFTLITEGTINANTAFVLSTPDSITLDTTDLTFDEFSFTDITHLNSDQTFRGVKTFGVSGDVGKLAIAGTTSGITVLDATAIASGTLTLPATTDTLVARDTVDTLTFKTIDANNNTISNLVIGAQVTGASTALTDTADIAYLNTANTWSTGIQSFVSASNLRIPVSAAPTIAVDGDIAYDTTVTDFSTGLITFFGTESQGVVSMPIAEFTSPVDGNVVSYNATNDEFELVTAVSGGITSLNSDTAAAQTLTGGTGIDITDSTPDHSFAIDGTVVTNNAANTWSTGIQSFVSASNLRIPVSAAPTIAVDGDIAYDTTVTDFSTGLITFFGTESQGVVSMPIAEFTSPVDGTVVSYNATNDEFELVTPSGGASSLNDLSDVTITSAAANQILIYNAGATAMENQTMGGDASIVANGTVTLVGTVVQTDQANTWSTGIQSFVSASNLRIPVSAAPTIAVDGDIAYDTTVTDFSTGLIRFFGTESQGVVSMPIAEFTSPVDGNVVSYNATNDEFELVTPSSGDMLLAGIQTVTGAKTFLDTTLLLRNVANTFNGSFVNTNTVDRVYTLQDSSDVLVGRDTTDTLTNKSIVYSGRAQWDKGANVASPGGGILTLGTDGNIFTITGTNTINEILATDWQAGSVIILEFSGILTVTNNSGGTNDIILGDGENYTTAAGESLELWFDGTDWREISRSTGIGGTTFPINFPEQASTSAVSPQVINFSANTRHAQRYVLTENTTFTFTGTTTDTTEYIDLLLVQDGTGNHTINLSGIVNAAQVEAGLNLGAGDETSITLKFHYGTFYAFLQGSDIFPINFPEQASATATASQEINFSANTRHAQRYVLDQATTTFSFAGTTTSTTEYIDLLLVQDGSGNRAIVFPGGTVNAAQVEAELDQTALAETSILVKFHYGTFYVFLQGGEALPVPDTTAIVEGSDDASKLLRFEVDGFTASNTRVITPPDANITLVNTSDGTISNTNVNASAAIDYSKLATLATGNILFGNTGVPTVGAMSGDATIDNTGALSLVSTVVQTDQANTWSTGIQSFVSASNLRIPVSAAPTIAVDGDIAYDTTVTDFSTGLIRFFGTEEQGVVSMPIAEFTSPTDGNVIAYNATNDEFELVTAAAVVTIQTATKSANQVLVDPVSDVIITDLTFTLPTRTGGFSNMTLFLKIQSNQNSASIIFEILDDGTPIAERLIFIGDAGDDRTVTFTFPVSLDGSTITVTATTVGQDVTVQGGGTNNQNASYIASFELS